MASIVAQLDGLPLAIELAAMHADVLGLADLEACLDEIIAETARPFAQVYP